MVASLLGRWARWRRGSLASRLAAALCVYFFFNCFTHTFWRLRRLSGPCVCGYTSSSSCALGLVVCVFVVAVVCSPAACGSLLFGSVRVSLIPCFFPCGRSTVKRV